MAQCCHYGKDADDAYDVYNTNDEQCDYGESGVVSAISDATAIDDDNDINNDDAASYIGNGNDSKLLSQTDEIDLETFSYVATAYLVRVPTCVYKCRRCIHVQTLLNALVCSVVIRDKA